MRARVMDLKQALKDACDALVGVAPIPGLRFSQHEKEIDAALEEFRLIRNRAEKARGVIVWPAIDRYRRAILADHSFEARQRGLGCHRRDLLEHFSLHFVILAKDVKAAAWVEPTRHERAGFLTVVKMTKAPGEGFQKPLGCHCCFNLLDRKILKGEFGKVVGNRVRQDGAPQAALLNEVTTLQRGDATEQLIRVHSGKS